MSNLAAQVVEWGKPLVVSELPRPTPGPGEALVHLLVRPVNPSDAGAVHGQYPGWRPQLPAVPGLEGMGVVEALGEGAAGVRVGQRVVPLLTRGGAFQAYACVPASDLIPLPDGVTDEAAAQFVVNPFSVWGLLLQANLPANAAILQTAAGSELGRMMIHAAKLRGHRTINLVRRAEQVEELRALGADVVICTEGNASLVEEIRKANGGQGVDVLFDCVGGSLTGKIAPALKNDRPVIIYGRMDHENPSLSPLELIFRGIRMEGFWLGTLLRTITPADRAAMVREVTEWMLSGRIAQHVGQTFPLTAINEALAASRAAGKPGKVLVYTSSK